MTVKADDSTGVDWNDATANERERVGMIGDLLTSNIQFERGLPKVQIFYDVFIDHT